MVCNTPWRYDADGDGNVIYGDGVSHMVTVCHMSRWCFTYGDGNVTRGGGIAYRGGMLHIKAFQHFRISKSIPAIIHMLPGIILIWRIVKNGDGTLLIVTVFHMSSCYCPSGHGNVTYGDSMSTLLYFQKSSCMQQLVYLFKRVPSLRQRALNLNN